uniref:7TM_GPCR_Srx domain-containing protein n=1 Tax=Meloidogyne hapla TaxID=6305 RepID=A0A1I8BBG0_MELHA
MILLLIQLFKSNVLLPLIGIHLLLIASIMFQLLQLLSDGHPTTELFVWFWLFSTTRSPKLSASIAPAPNRAVWIQQTNLEIPLQQNQRLLNLERRQSPPNLQLENLINLNEINN